MPTSANKKWIKWLVIIAIVIIFCAIHTCKSKAETYDPVHTYGPEFNTPDPSQDIYDLLETDEPVITDEPEFSFDPDFTFIPLPFPTSEPSIPNSNPLPWNIKFDPFFVDFDLINGEAVEQWTRLNGSNQVYTPPVNTSVLHTTPYTSYSYTEGEDNYQWQSIYEYSFNPNGVSQANTWFRPGGGSLVYMIYQNLSTSNTNRILKSGDHIQFSFTPNISMLSSIAAEMYDPVVDLLVTFDYGTGPGVYIKNSFRLSEGTFSFDYEVQPRVTGYLQGYTVRLIINPFTAEYPEPEDNTVIYWFESTANGALAIRYYRDKTWLDSVGDFIGNGVTTITNFISSIFVPNEEQLQAWVTAHSSDQLDSGNPLNLVKDLFVTMMNKFSGYAPSGRPVIEVPALSFDVDGQKVTPFEGYRWEIGNEGIVDGGGNNLWYYVKLATSILICGGLVGKMWSWFKKWYDAHYSSDGGST